MYDFGRCDRRCERVCCPDRKLATRWVEAMNLAPQDWAPFGAWGASGATGYRVGSVAGFRFGERDRRRWDEAAAYAQQDEGKEAKRKKGVKQ
jgi:hypothetical protein